MYEVYWKLTDKPFQNTFNPYFFYNGPQHQDALMKLAYCIQEGMGAGLLTGGFGCGKTFLVQKVISQLNHEKFKFIFISHPSSTSIDLLVSICCELGDNEVLIKAKETPFIESIVWGSLKNQIYNNYLSGKVTVVIIDEAHIINDINVFEALRLLLNLQEKDKFLLTLILVGQPELVKKVENLKPLEQRIAVKASIGSLDQTMVKDYILHRLKVAGRNEPIFTDEAMEFIYESTGGIPRNINRICDLALLSGFMHKVDKIGLGILQSQAQGVENRPKNKPDEGLFNPKSVFIFSKNSKKDIEQIYNGGLLLTESLLNRAEKKEPVDTQLILPVISGLIERFKIYDANLLSLVYKKNTSDYLNNHLLGVFIFSMVIGLELNLTEDTLIDLGLSAILYDLGLVYLRHIIQVSRKLNPEEYESVKTHPKLTVEFLEKSNEIKETTKLTILNHHERTNGQGYPRGLKGENINLEAKILAVADVWEALTHSRPWRNKFAPHEAIYILRDLSESMLDYQIVKILVDKLSIYPIGSLVKLNNAEIGEVVSAERGFPTILKIIFDTECKRLDKPKLIEMSNYPNLYISHPVEEKEVN